MDKVQQRRKILDDASIAGAVMEAQRLLAFIYWEAKQPKDIGEPAEELRRLTHELDLLVPQLDILYEAFAEAYVRTAEQVHYTPWMPIIYSAKDYSRVHADGQPWRRT